MLSFIMPIRHPDNVSNKEEQFNTLNQTFRSIGAQTGDAWEAVVVANSGQVLPELTRNMRVVWVDHPPNAALDRARTRAEVYEAIQLDKGGRIAAAADEIDAGRHIMVVDDDDLIHRRLSEFIASQNHRSGWCVDQGYIWQNGSRFLRRTRGFFERCGTSLIVPKEYYLKYSGDTINPANPARATRELGSHTLIFDRVPMASSTWRFVPFLAAIYRLGHSNASQRVVDVSKASSGHGGATPTLRSRLAWCAEKASRLSRTRVIGSHVRRDFFGE